MKITQLGDLVAIQTGKLDANASSPDGAFPFFTCSREPLKIDHWRYDLDAVLVAGNGDLNVKHYQGKFEAYQRTYILSVKGGKPLNTRYLYYFMDSYLDELRAQSIGGIIKYIKLGMLTKAPIPLPPLAEQRRIAAILDQADALRRARRRAIERLNDLGQAIFYEMFGDPVANPKGWPLKAISQLGEVVTGNTPSRAIGNYYGGTLEWIKSDNLNTDEDYVTVAEECISDKGRSVARIAPANSVLVTCIAGSPSCIGNAAILDREAAFNQQINAIIPQDASTVFLYAQTIVGKKLIQRASTSSMKGMVSKSRFEAVKFIVPPLELQCEFARSFSLLMQNKQLAKEALQASDDLFSSLQQRAFRGNL
jgi:type I restriction enzyme S subunit